MAKKRIVDDKELIAEIVEVLEQMDGDDLAQAHNEICANQAKYLEDSQWEITVVL